MILTLKSSTNCRRLQSMYRISAILLCVALLARCSSTTGVQWPAWFASEPDDGPVSALSTNDSARGRVLLADGAHCGPLSPELVQRVAQNNTVLVTAIDKLLWKSFGPSYVENIMAANITYWLVVALDPETSLALAAQGVTQCFNAPPDRLKYRGTDVQYAWGSHHWSQTTWNKVHMVRAVYELGVHVIHSDADVVWFRDPLPFFLSQLDGPAHIIMSIDAVFTHNRKDDFGLELSSSPFTNINTGIYFYRQWQGGLEFFDMIWLPMQDKNIGHDQDGLNTVVRGGYYEENIREYAIIPRSTDMRVFYAAFSIETAVSFLPSSMFGNTYTYVNARLWEKLEHPLYAVHWVWGGSSMETKRQNMRDAMKFHDEPDYYTSPHLVTFDLDHLWVPEDFNDWLGTEEMIRYHVMAANYQLQQAYYAFAVALITNRTLVMPRFHCFCSKNWYQTQRCRINEEKVTTFPFVCSLSQLMRVKRLAQGLSLPDNTEYSGHKVFIREYSFLENPKVPDELKKSLLEIQPSERPRAASLRADQLVVSEEAATRGYGRRITVAAPLADWELRALLAGYKDVRVLHLPKPGSTLSGFSKPDTHNQFDAEIQKYVAYWCCRAPPDMVAMNLTDKVQLVALPPGRYNNLPALKGASYGHEFGPIRRTNGQVL